MRALIILAVFLFLTNLTFGNLALGYESNSDSSLSQTKELLRNKQMREKAVSESKQAQEAHSRAKSLLKTPQNVDKAYDMAAIMMEQIMKEAEGDPTKAQQILQKGLANPAGLAERMPSEFKDALKNLGADVESFGSPTRK